MNKAPLSNILDITSKALYGSLDNKKPIILCKSNIICGNSLDMNLGESFDYFITNPPFGKKIKK